MLEDRQNSRILFEDGISLVDNTVLAKMILKGTEIPDTVKTIGGKDVDVFKTVFGTDLSFDENTDRSLQNPIHLNDEASFEQLVSLIRQSPRFVNDEKILDRLEKELEFFNRTGNIGFLLAVNRLFQKFKEDGVVWGIGRGSACASLVLYILGVHDIDPVKYDIRFSELSKDIEDD